MWGSICGRGMNSGRVAFSGRLDIRGPAGEYQKVTSNSLVRMVELGQGVKRTLMNN